MRKKAAARPRDEDASDGAGSDSSEDFGRAGKVRRGGSATMGNSLEPIPQNGPAPRPVVDTSSSPVKIGAPILKELERIRVAVNVGLTGFGKM